MAAGLLLWLLAGPVAADPVRVAVFNVGLSRDGPGLLLRDIARDDPQAAAVARIIAAARPDIVLLLGFDWDAQGRALRAFGDLIRRDHGLIYPYVFSPPQNAGVDSGLDLDGDGRLRGGADAFGFGEFRGQGGMALLSRLPLGAARDFSGVLWRQLPGAMLPVHADGAPFPSDAAQAAMRLAAFGFWDVEATLPGGRTLHLLASYSSPPVFDGPEDINGLRNRDELRFWRAYLEGAEFRGVDGRAARFSGGNYVLLAGLNTDPADGEGARDVLARLLTGGLFDDPRPKSRGGLQAAARQGGVNAAHRGDPATDTADWRDDAPPGNLRVDYVLPSPALAVAAAGVVWPADDEPLYETVAAAQELGTRHRLVWVDLR